MRCSISLLPESLAAGVTGSLDAIEAAVDAIEAGGMSAAVDLVHPADVEDAIGLEAARRSLRRRARWVYPTLITLVSLLADRLSGVAPTLHAMRIALGVERVLVALRSVAEMHLGAVARPLGFRARVSA